MWNEFQQHAKHNAVTHNFFFLLSFTLPNSRCVRGKYRFYLQMNNCSVQNFDFSELKLVWICYLSFCLPIEMAHFLLLKRFRYCEWLILFHFQIGLLKWMIMCDIFMRSWATQMDHALDLSPLGLHGSMCSPSAFGILIKMSICSGTNSSSSSSNNANKLLHIIAKCHALAPLPLAPNTWISTSIKVIRLKIALFLQNGQHKQIINVNTCIFLVFASLFCAMLCNVGTSTRSVNIHLFPSECNFEMSECVGVQVSTDICIRFESSRISSSS